MGRRLMVVMSVGMLFAVSLVVSAVSLAQEGRANGANLTPEQREQFVEGAKEIAGLSDEEIAAALKSPAAVDAIPVRVEESQDLPETPARDGARGARAASNCTGMAATRSYVNARNQKLFSFSGRKYWCFNYTSAVTYAPRATFGYTITKEGRESGWEFRGVAERAEKYVSFRGFPRGSHVSRFVLGFRTCNPGSGCIRVFPQYRGVGNYDGTGYQTTKTLDAAPS